MAKLIEQKTSITFDYLEKISSIIFLALDRSYLIVDCNNAFTTFLQLNDKPIGRPLSDFILDKDDIRLLEECCSNPNEFRKINMVFSLKTPTMHMYSFNCIFNGKFFFLFGEKIISHEGNIVAEFSLLSNQLNNINRDLHKKNMELQIAKEKIEISDKMLKAEIEKARQIHQRHIPKFFPNIPGLSFASYYMAAEKLGGDFYDVIQIEDKVVLYLSDVSGHGLDGAMLSVFVKNTINSYLSLSPKEKLTPEAIIDHLANRYYQENYPDEYFVAIFLAVLDTNKMILNYLGAGFQTPPIVSLKNTIKCLLFSKCLPISCAISKEFMEIESSSIDLTPGTTILFSTDGITEQEVNGISYHESLKNTFLKNCSLSPSTIIKAITEDFRQFNKGSVQAQDDITIIVMQVS